MNKIRLSAEDHARVGEAITAAEKRTSGEIFVVVAGISDDYAYIAGFVAALWAILSGCLLVLLTHLWGVALSPLLVMASVTGQFAFLCLLFWWSEDWRLIFVPNRVRFQRASANAVRQFLAHGIHKTQDRTGLLLFVSIAEHYVEIVADAGIDGAVKQDDWNQIVEVMVEHAARDEIAEGLVTCVGLAGDLLAQHFPPEKGGKNELDDKLIEL